MSQERTKSPNPAAAAAAAASVVARRALADRSHRDQNPVNTHHPRLNFPKLEPDGSAHSLTSHSSRVHEPTPPAALSTLGIRTRMMQRAMDVSYSTGSLVDSQYDMIDDLSEISDDHETASLASNDRETTLDGESELDEEEQEEGVILAPSSDGQDAHYDYVTLPSQDVIGTERVREAERQHDIKRENDLLDSYMSEDLETPRQSTLSHKLAAKASPVKKSPPPRDTMKSFFGLFQGITLLPTFAAILLVCLPYGLLFALRFTADHPSVSLVVRRESLAAALTDIVDVAGLGRTLDVEHLLPQVDAECVSTDIFGRHSISPACKQSVRYQGLSPNLMIVAFPGYGHFPSVVAAEVIKSEGRKIDFNLTELIEGVHAIAFDPQEAFGLITVSLTTKKPAMDVQASHNYGSRMLQRKTYENAGADVSNAVSKEVAIMRDAAKTLTGKVSTELKVGYRATKSVTTELALAMSRDLQVFASTAATVFGKAAKASNNTATAITKDFVLLQRDLVKFSKEISTSVTSAIRQAKRDTKTAFRNPLVRSRDHLFDLGHAFSSITSQHKLGSKKERSACSRSKAKERSSGRSNSNGRTSASSVPLEEPAQPSQLCQRQVTRALQQIERVHRHIERKEQEFRETGHREVRKEIRQLKKEHKRRSKALKKLVKDLKHR